MENFVDAQAPGRSFGPTLFHMVKDRLLKCSCSIALPSAPMISVDVALTRSIDIFKIENQTRDVIHEQVISRTAIASSASSCG
jgi:hypothetical protein